MADELFPYQDHDLNDLAERIIEYRDTPMPGEADSVYQGMEDLKELHEELNRRIEDMMDVPDPSDGTALEEAVRRWELATEAGRQAFRQYDRYEQEALRHLHAELEAEVTTSEAPYLDQLIAEAGETVQRQAEAREPEPQETEVAAVQAAAGLAWGANALSKAYQAYQKVPEALKSGARSIGTTVGTHAIEQDGEEPEEPTDAEEEDGNQSTPRTPDDDKVPDKKVEELDNRTRNRAGELMEGIEGAGDQPDRPPRDNTGNADYTRPANARILDREQAGAPENSDMPSVIRDPEAPETDVTPTRDEPSTPSGTPASLDSGGGSTGSGSSNESNFQRMRIEQLRQNLQQSRENLPAFPETPPEPTAAPELPPAQETPTPAAEFEALFGNNPELKESVDQLKLGDSAKGDDVRQDGQAATITPRARSQDRDDLER